MTNWQAPGMDEEETQTLPTLSKKAPLYNGNTRVSCRFVKTSGRTAKVTIMKLSGNTLHEQEGYCPEVIWLSKESPSTNRTASPGVDDQKDPWVSHTIQAIATVIGCTVELDGKITSPKTLHILARRHKEIGLGLNQNLPAG